MIGYLKKVLKSLFLILPKRKDYVKTFKVEDGDSDKNNKFMFLATDEEKLLQEHKTIWTKIEQLKNIELNALPFNDQR